MGKFSLGIPVLFLLADFSSPMEMEIEMEMDTIRDNCGSTADLIYSADETTQQNEADNYDTPSGTRRVKKFASKFKMAMVSLFFVVLSLVVFSLSMYYKSKHGSVTQQRQQMTQQTQQMTDVEWADKIEEGFAAIACGGQSGSTQITDVKWAEESEDSACRGQWVLSQKGGEIESLLKFLLNLFANSLASKPFKEFYEDIIDEKEERISKLIKAKFCKLPENRQQFVGKTQGEAWIDELVTLGTRVLKSFKKCSKERMEWFQDELKRTEKEVLREGKAAGVKYEKDPAEDVHLKVSVRHASNFLASLIRSIARKVYKPAKKLPKKRELVEILMKGIDSQN